MKTTLLLNDESAAAKMLENITPIKAIARPTKAVAGCTCDRWGHPCSGRDEPKVQSKTNFASSAPAKQMS